MKYHRKYKISFLEKFLIISIGIAIALFAYEAHSMDLRTYYEATPANEAVVSRLLKQDSNLTVTVILYAPEWTHEGRETDMVTPGMKIAKRLFNKFGGRVSVLFANLAGLKEDPIPIPPGKGVYFYLD